MISDTATASGNPMVISLSSDRLQLAGKRWENERILSIETFSSWALKLMRCTPGLSDDMDEAGKEEKDCLKTQLHPSQSHGISTKEM